MPANPERNPPVGANQYSPNAAGGYMRQHPPFFRHHLVSHVAQRGDLVWCWAHVDWPLRTGDAPAPGQAYSPDRHHRCSRRLQGYDYAQAGAYFVTLVTHERACLFGEIVDGRMILNEAGRAVEACWQAIPEHFPEVELDAFVVMPNHVHGILAIAGSAPVGAHQHSPSLLRDGGDGDGAKDEVGSWAKDFSPLRNQRVSLPGAHAPLVPFRSPSKTVGSIMRGFKIGVTKWMRENTDTHMVWQRNYHDHIIRDEADLERIREYVANNPDRWAADAENPTP